MTEPIVLASGSHIRQQLLRQARVHFDVILPRVDEDSIRQSMLAEGATPRNIADSLAEAKALKVAQKAPDRYVLACDQILSVDGTILSKPHSIDQARSHLEQLSGRSHTLLSAAVIYEKAQPVWRKVGIVQLHMKTLSPTYLTAYLDRNWDSIQHSVGGYKLEEEGARLFHKIEGDYFHVLGLPFLEILAYLELRGVIEG